MFSKKKKPFNPYESARTMYFMKYGKRATAFMKRQGKPLRA